VPRPGPRAPALARARASAHGRAPAAEPARGPASHPAGRSARARPARAPRRPRRPAARRRAPLHGRASRRHPRRPPRVPRVLRRAPGGRCRAPTTAEPHRAGRHRVFRSRARAPEPPDDRRGPAAGAVPRRAPAALTRLQPVLLDACWKSPDPDEALNQFERFLAAAGPRAGYVELLAARPELLAGLVRLCAGGDLLAQLLVAQPELLSSLADRSVLEGRRTRADFRAALAPVFAPGL